jgi:multidrug efflux pump subunit AcrB
MNYKDLFAKAMKLLGVEVDPELSELEQLDIVEKMQPLATSIESQNKEMSDLKNLVSDLSKAVEGLQKNNMTEEVVNNSIDAKIKIVASNIKQELASEFSALKTNIESNLKPAVSTAVVSEVETGSGNDKKDPIEIKVIQRKTPFGNVSFQPSQQGK